MIDQLYLSGISVPLWDIDINRLFEPVEEAIPRESRLGRYIKSGVVVVSCTYIKQIKENIQKMSHKIENTLRSVRCITAPLGIRKYV